MKGILSEMIPGENPVTLDLGEISIVAVGVLPSMLTNMSLDKGSAEVKLPPGNEIIELAGDSPVTVIVSSPT